MAKYEVTGSCVLCGRSGQQLAMSYAGVSDVPRLECADQASCVRARIARDASLARHPSGQGRSAYRDQAEQLCAEAQEIRGQPGHAGIVLAVCSATQALLAVAEAVTTAPAADLVGVLDSALDNIRSELAVSPDFTPEMREDRT